MKHTRLIKNLIKRALSKKGLDLIPHDPRNFHLLRKALLFENYHIDLVLDVGASDGGYVNEIRANGYEGRICSFEPRAVAFHSLEQKFNSDKKWRAINCALGRKRGTCEINISENGDSSSLLKLAADSGNNSVHVAYVGKETVSLQTLDEIIEPLCADSKSVLLKLDVQGFETEVLAGAQKSLKLIDTIQLELALTPTYQNQAHLHEMCSLMHEMGYTVVSIEPGCYNPATGQQFEVDGLFHRYAQPR